MEKIEGISFREDFGCWWPDYDHNPEACFKKVKGRLLDANLCTRYTASRNTVIQAGGHAGWWPMQLANHFKRVLAFEPDPLLFACMVRNVAKSKHINIDTYPAALGAINGSAKYNQAASAGSGKIVSGKHTHVVEMITVDSMNLSSCDAIILDVEGYEVEVLKGAEHTIKKYRPVIHLETSNVEDQDRWMYNNGYAFVLKMHNDRLFTYQGR